MHGFKVGVRGRVPEEIEIAYVQAAYDADQLGVPFWPTMTADIDAYYNVRSTKPAQKPSAAGQSNGSLYEKLAPLLKETAVDADERELDRELRLIMQPQPSAAPRTKFKLTPQQRKAILTSNNPRRSKVT